VPLALPVLFLRRHWQSQSRPGQFFALWKFDNDDLERDELAEDDDLQDDVDRDDSSHVQPSGSTVVIERSTTGLTATIPPVGLRAGSKGMFAFGLIWCTGLAIFTTIIVAAGTQQPGESLLGLLAFLSLFWLVGIGLLLGGINMGRRRAAIAIVDDELMILQTSIFRSRSRSWKSGEVTTVQAGPSGMEVNDRPVLELQVISASGDKFGLLGGRDENELRWLANEIRQSLQLGAPDRQAATAEIMQRDVEMQPAASRITLETFPQGFSLTVPPAGIWHGSQGFVGLGLGMCVILTAITAGEFWFGMRIGSHPIATLLTLGGWGASLAVLVAGLNIGLRRAAIAVARQRLMVAQSSFFGSKKKEYEPGEVTAARAAPSGLGKDYEGLVELQILTRDGEKQSYLCGRDKHELFWIATLIRQHLNVPAEVGREPDAEIEEDEESTPDEQPLDDQDPSHDDRVFN
jgi:hypothetical protein